MGAGRFRTSPGSNSWGCDVPDLFDLTENPQPPAPAAARGDLFDLTENPTRALVFISAKEGRPFEEVASALKGEHGLDASAVSESSYRLESARSRAATEEQPLWLSALRKAPALGTVTNTLLEREYGQAARRIAAGRGREKGEGGAKFSDYDLVAQYERLQQIEKDRSLLGTAGQAIASLPALIAETAAGGGALRSLKILARGRQAQTAAETATNAALGRGALNVLGRGTADVVARTAATPLFYSQEAARNLNEAATRGKDSLADGSRAVGAAFAYGVAQNAIVGQIFKPATGSRLGAILTKTPRGMAEQQAVDVLAGVSDIKTGYGILGDVVKGKNGEALKAAVGQIVTFGALAGFHGKSAEPVVRAGADVLKDLHTEGVPADEAARVVAEATRRVEEVIASDPEVDPEKVRAAARDLPEGDPVRDAVEAFAGAVPEPPKPLYERPLEDWHIEELRSEAGKRGLVTGGTRAELVDRLRSSDEQPKSSGEAKVLTLGNVPPETPRTPPEAPKVEPTPEPAGGEIGPQTRSGEPGLAGLRLGAPTAAGVNPRGESITGHTIYDPAGKPVGKVRLQKSGGTLNVEWVGMEGMASGEGRGKAPAGTREVLRLARALADAYPDAVLAKYTPGAGRIAEGATKYLDLQKVRERQGRAGRVAGMVVASAEPPAPPAPPLGMLGRLRAAQARRPPAVAGPAAVPLTPRAVADFADAEPPRTIAHARVMSDLRAMGLTGRELQAVDALLANPEITGREIGERFGVTRQRVGQIEKVIAEKLGLKDKDGNPLTLRDVIKDEPVAGKSERGSLEDEATREYDDTLDLALKEIESAPESERAGLWAKLQAEVTPDAIARRLEVRRAPGKGAGGAAAARGDQGAQGGGEARPQPPAEGTAPAAPGPFAVYRQAEGGTPELVSRHSNADEARTAASAEARRHFRGGGYVERRRGDTYEAEGDTGRVYAERVEAEPATVKPTDLPLGTLKAILREINQGGNYVTASAMVSRIRETRHGQQLLDAAVAKYAAKPPKAAPKKKPYVSAAERDAAEQEARAAQLEQMRGLEPDEVVNLGDLGKRTLGEVSFDIAEMGKEIADAEAASVRAGSPVEPASQAVSLGVSAGEAQGEAEGRRNQPRPPEPTPGAVGTGAGAGGRVVDHPSGFEAPGTERGEPAGEQRRVADRLTQAELDDRAAADSLFGKPSDDLPAGMGAASVPGAPPPEPGRVRQLWEAAKDRIGVAARAVADNWRELAGVIAPRTARESESAADSIARFVAAETHAERAAPYLADRVLGPVRDAAVAEAEAGGVRFQEERFQRAANKLMATLYEERFRHAAAALRAESLRLAREAYSLRGRNEPRARELFNRSMEAAQAAREVKTFVGRENAGLDTESLYQESLASPEYKAFKERWKEHVVPVTEGFYRKAEGLEPDDPIESSTQLPDLPFNAKAVREGDPTPDPRSIVYTTGAPGNLKNPQARKLGFARAFTGSAGGYDIDPAAVIANSVRRAAGLAAKAEMYRTLEREGLAHWDRQGARIEQGGTRLLELPNVRPPKGTQAATEGQTSLYLHPSVEKEVRRALAVDKPWKRVPGSQGLTNIALMALVEATTHAKNLSTFVFKPGVNPVGIARNFYRVVTGDPGAMRRVVELAELGAVKPQGLESAPGAERTKLSANPITWLKAGREWMGRALDTIDLTMRLSADAAFDSLARRGLVGGTEYNRRNFINQLGQYQRRGQNDVIAFLRETGLGPFATAGSNYTMQGLRGLVFSPGVSATSYKAAAQLRAETFLRVAAVMSVAPILNYLMWGRADGDDRTPIGGVKVRDAQGKTGYVDLAAMTGLPRGARAVGLLAMAEGRRAGTRPEESTKRAREDVLHGLLHPAEGPVVAAGLGLMTGRNPIGMPIAPKAKPGENQVLLDAWGAAMNANPVVASLTGADRPTQRVNLPEERAMRLLGPFGLKYRASPPGRVVPSGR